MSDDLIRRQAAIDETWKMPSHTDPLNVLTEIRDRIEALPSAETNCVTCKHYEESDGKDGIVGECHAKEDRLAVALMGYMLEYVPWYHIKDGELVEGARSDMEALYKASDIRAMIEKIGKERK